tara:strand:+ start:1859 stop:3547 length:1689 start_codon:yes stop_codon:yes gene_type:complete
VTDNKENKEPYIVKTFTIPTEIEEIKENITINTSTKTKTKTTRLSKEEIINRGLVLHSEGNIVEAVKKYQYCIDQGFEDTRVLTNYANILQKENKLNKAIEFYRKSLNLVPNQPDTYSLLGEALKDIGKLEEAKVILQKAIKMDPNNAKNYKNLGGILIKFNQLQEAKIFTKKAIELNLNFAEAYANLGVISTCQGDLEEAEKHTRKAIEIKPDFTQAFSNLGSILNDLGKLKDAEVYLNKAITLNPELSDAHQNLSLVFLKSKRFKEGWNKYEWRWKVGEKQKLVTSKPEWKENNNGRVLLWAEQGIGDEILFASLIPEFQEKVDQLILKVDKRLIPLFKRSFNKSIIYIDKNSHINEDKYDYQIGMGSLPKFLRNSDNSFRKGKKAYLKADKGKTKLFRDRLNHSSFKKIIGISWRSDSIVNKQKSMTLEEFIIGIYSPNLCFVNLQYGDNKEEINNIKEKYNINIFELNEVDLFYNIDGLASIISACDLVISIENMIHTLTGALGIESKILLTRNCLYFNGLNDTKSYWFPSQEFFRKGSSKDWGIVLKNIKERIKLAN